MANKIAYHNTIINIATGVGLSATITIYDQGTEDLSTIYSDPEGTAKDNPFTTDIYGRFEFYADPGEYDIQVSGDDITTYTLEDVSIIGDYSRFVTSQPLSGQRQIVGIRYDADDEMIVKYNSVAEE